MVAPAVTDNTTSVVVTSVNDAPAIASTPTATPNPAVTSQSVQFNVSATDADNDVLTYTWDFKDGTSSTSQNPTHAFSTPGTYAVSVTITDGRGGSVSGSVTVTVASAGPGGDSDGDGFPDEIETALNTNPFSAASTPFGLSSPVANAVITVPKVTFKLNFTKDNLDTLTLNGHLPVNGLKPINQIIIVDVGGVVRAFTLNAQGKGTANKRDTIKLNIAQVSPSPQLTRSNFTLQIRNGSFKTALLDEQLTAVPATRSPRSVKVTAILLNTVFTATVPQLYSFRAGKGSTVTTK